MAVGRLYVYVILEAPIGFTFEKDPEGLKTLYGTYIYPCVRMYVGALQQSRMYVRALKKARMYVGAP